MCFTQLTVKEKAASDEGRSLLWRLTAEAASTAAAAQKKDNPDEITSVVSSAAVMFEEAATAATAAQDQDEPDYVTSTSSVPTFTAASTPTICCC